MRQTPRQRAACTKRRTAWWPTRSIPSQRVSSSVEPLTRPELAVAGIAETGDDVTLVVEALVEGGDVDRNIGVRARERAHPLRRRDDPDVLDPLRSPLLEDVDGRGRGSAGREHWIEDEADLNGRRRRQLVVVLYRPQGVLAADKPDVPDLRLRHELERGFDHPDARAEHRHKSHRLRELRALGVRERRLHRRLVHRKVRGRFIQEKRRDLADERAEVARVGPLVAKPRDLLPQERVRRNVELRCAQSTAAVAPIAGRDASPHSPAAEPRRSRSISGYTG